MIKLIQPSITLKSINDELKEIFDSGQFTQGKYVDLFQNSLQDYLGVEYVGLTTSATTALALGLRVMGVKPGDKVAVSDYSWPASSNVIEELGATPVFIDIDNQTFNMSATDLEKKINDRFAAVIFVDTFGNPSGIKEIKNICTRHNVPLLEDAACALGSKIDDIKVGAFSDITCFSFHPRKVLNTGEGGAITTNNKKYIDDLKIKLSAGASGKAEIGLNFVDFGFNFRLTEIQALMGWKQLLTLDELINERNKIKEDYITSLENYKFAPQKIETGIKHNSQSVVFLVPDNINRNDLVKYLLTKDIESTLGTYCLSATSFNKAKYNEIQETSSLIHSKAITLPCYQGLEVKKVAHEIINYTAYK